MAACGVRRREVSEALDHLCGLSYAGDLSRVVERSP
jgi:hypothetical protein